MIIIKKWYGRLGNNIFQLYNTILLGICYKENVSIPKHALFTQNIIKIFDKNTESRIIFDNTEFQFSYANKLIEQNHNSEIFLNHNHHDRIIQIIRSILPKSMFHKNSKNNHNENIIHIRSGDIMFHPHRCYIPPPLSFYKSIIEKDMNINWTIICEDNVNPCVNYLVNEYSNVTFKRDTLVNDIETILHAKSIVMSIGTFVPALLMLSQNRKTIYYPDYFFELDKCMYYVFKHKLNDIFHDCCLNKLAISETYLTQNPRNFKNLSTVILNF